MARRQPWIGALIVVCAGALALRLIGLRYGLPAVYNPDEIAIMSRALAFAKGDLNPHNFLYPTFYFYVLFAWEGLTALWSVATGAVASFSAFQQEFFLDPTRVFVAGRLLTALLGTATVAATFTLGRRVDGPAAGLIAAIFLAISPLHVRDSHYVKHDVPVTLLIVLAYLSYVRLMERDDDEGFARTIALPGALTGAAFATHYYTIFLAIPLAWAVAQRGRGAADAIRRIVAAGLVAGLVFFALSPFVVLEPITAWRDIRANQQIVVDRAAGTLGYAQTAAHYALLLWRDTVTWPLMVLAIAGLVILAVSRPRLALLLLAFPVPFFLFIAGTFPATRYLIPLVPFLVTFASIPVATIVRRQPAAAIALACLAAALPLRDSLRAILFIRQADTRTLAQAFVERVVPEGRTILTQAYSAPLTPTAASLEEAVKRSGQPMPTKTKLEIARRPYPSPAYRLILLGQGRDVDKLYMPYDQLDGGDPLAAARAERVAFVVLKRYNTEDPRVVPFITALARSGRRIAEFSPYRDRAGGRPEPFLHNTDARIEASLERPGPVVEIWQIDGPGS
jgi:uncharacterized membrane protein